eukprot:846541-Amorphochlora_amoeboformis.AAC.1
MPNPNPNPEPTPIHTSPLSIDETEDSMGTLENSLESGVSSRVSGGSLEMINPNPSSFRIASLGHEAKYFGSRGGILWRKF